MPMPKPNSGEPKDKFISRCMGSDTMKSEFPDQKQRTAVCFDQWRGKSESMLRYARPIKITENRTEEGRDKKLYITGNAIDAGVSKNNVEYAPNVLQNAVKSMIGKPIILNHDAEDVRNIVGKVVSAEYGGKNVPFKAEIDRSENWLVNKLRNGYINKVSIGAEVVDENGNYAEIEPDDDGIIRPKGIEFHEISLVTIPGVPNASINKVIAESYKVKRMSEEEKKDEQTSEEALKKENAEMKERLEKLEKKLAEQEAEDDSSNEEESSDSDEKAEAEPETEPKEPKESAEVKALKEQVKTLTEKVSSIADKPKGVAETSEEPEKKEEAGFKVVTVDNPMRGSDIYSSSVAEKAEPGSGRKWMVY